MFWKPSWGPQAARRAGGTGSQWVEIVARTGFECRLWKIGPLTDFIGVDIRFYASGRQEDVKGDDEPS